MRIGSENNFLMIEVVPVKDGCPVLQVEAVASASGRRFTASHDRLLISRCDLDFSDFDSLKSNQFEVAFTEGGWLRFQRDLHGNVTIKYRIGGWSASAAMDGEVTVDGEFANKFCREFGALLQSQKH